MGVDVAQSGEFRDVVDDVEISEERRAVRHAQSEETHGFVVVLVFGGHRFDDHNEVCAPGEVPTARAVLGDGMGVAHGDSSLVWPFGSQNTQVACFLTYFIS